MSDPKLESVFQISGVPTHTFVEPQEYSRLLVSLRTPGRGVVVEGPSGIGKTTSVDTALQAVNASVGVTKLTARKRGDLEYINNIPELGGVGVVIIDDFHRLPDDTKSRLADYLKTLADEGRTDTKVVIVGINRAGERLIDFAPDLVNRLDIVRLESNSETKVRELIRKGESALNISINVTDEIVDAARGGFYVAQLLCHEVCLRGNVLERSDEHRSIELSFEAVRAAVWSRLDLRFAPSCKLFSRGTKMKAVGRAPYLNILKLLSESDQWSLSLSDAIRKRADLRGSIEQVVSKGFLQQLFDSNPSLGEILHFDSGSRTLAVEDPQLVFYLKNIPWASFASELGFVSVDFKSRYDFALSFAGSDRFVAEALFNELSESEVEVFYDKNEQHRIIAEDVEEYLRPIYHSEATYVVCLLGPDYPSRIWTKFESDAFRDRFKSGSIVPISFKNAPLGIFDAARRVGLLEYDPDDDLHRQVQEFAQILLRKLNEAKQSGRA